MKTNETETHLKCLQVVSAKVLKEVFLYAMFGNSWNKEDENELANLDLTMSSLRMLDETAQKGFLFKAIRGNIDRRY